MKKKNLVLTLAITLSIALGSTAYAAANSTTNGYHQGSGTGLGRISGFRGFDIITNALKSKGVTDTEITNALNSGKTLNSLATEKGITTDELKKSLLEGKTKIIDEAVAKGSLTKEQGDAEKARIAENIDNCTTPGQMAGRMVGGNRGNSRGMNGNGCLYNSGVSK